MLKKLKAVLSRRSDYERTFGSPHGQRVLADILQKTKTNATVFHANNQRQNDFLLGRQSVGYQILDWLNLSDEQIENLKKQELHHD